MEAVQAEDLFKQWHAHEAAIISIKRQLSGLVFTPEESIKHHQILINKEQVTKADIIRLLGDGAKSLYNLSVKLGFKNVSGRVETLISEMYAAGEVTAAVSGKTIAYSLARIQEKKVKPPKEDSATDAHDEALKAFEPKPQKNIKPKPVKLSKRDQVMKALKGQSEPLTVNAIWKLTGGTTNASSTFSMLIKGMHKDGDLYSDDGKTFELPIKDDQ